MGSEKTARRFEESGQGDVRQQRQLQAIRQAALNMVLAYRSGKPQVL